MEKNQYSYSRKVEYLIYLIYISSGKTEINRRIGQIRTTIQRKRFDEPKHTNKGNSSILINSCI